LKKRLRPANVEVIKLKLGSQEPRVVGAELERCGVGRQGRSEEVGDVRWLVEPWLQDPKPEIMQNSQIFVSNVGT